MFIKTLSCILILTMLLSGCGNTVTSVSQSNISALPSSSSSSVVVSDIGMSQDEIIALIDSRNSKNGYNTIAQAKKAEAVAEISSEENYICTRYTLQTGVTICFWAETETLAVRQFNFEVDKNTCGASGAELSGYICVSLPFFFEPDDYKQLTSDLQILGTDIADNIYVEKETRTYIYNNQAESESFSVIPPQGSLLTTDGLTFVDVITPLTIDSYLDKLLPSMEAGDLDIGVFKSYSDDNSELGYSGRVYSLGTETWLMLFESKDTGEIDEVYLDCNVLEADELEAKSFVHIASVSMMMFEEENYETVNAAIQLATIQKNDKRLVNGKLFDYLYTIDNGQLGLTMLRHDSEMFNRYTNSGQAPASSSLPDAKPDANAPVAEQTPPKAIEHEVDTPASTPTFTGGTCLSSGIDSYNGGPPKVTTEFSESDTVFLAGKFTGLVGEQNIVIEWTLPDGKTNKFTMYAFKNNESLNTSSGYQNTGVGDGTVTITLESSGAVLAVYNYTVV